MNLVNAYFNKQLSKTKNSFYFQTTAKKSLNKASIPSTLFHKTKFFFTKTYFLGVSVKSSGNDRSTSLAKQPLFEYKVKGAHKLKKINLIRNNDVFELLFKNKLQKYNKLGQLQNQDLLSNVKNNQQNLPSVINSNNKSYNSSLSNLSNNENKNYYTSYCKLSEIKLLTIGIASPLRILQWAEKTLPNGKIYGEVLNANTLHHKTFKPQKGGLFCERIFGPLKDFECACGKIDKSTNRIVKPPNETLGSGNNEKNRPFGFLKTGTRKFCPDCDVEYTWSVIRRYQLGYIKLCSPVTHIWFLKGTPSYLSLLLDMKKRHLQLVTYCSEILTIEKSSFPSSCYLLSNVSNSLNNLNTLNNTTSFQNDHLLSGRTDFNNENYLLPVESNINTKIRNKSLALITAKQRNKKDWFFWFLFATNKGLKIPTKNYLNFTNLQDLSEFNKPILFKEKTTFDRYDQRELTNTLNQPKKLPLTSYSRRGLVPKGINQQFFSKLSKLFVISVFSTFICNQYEINNENSLVNIKNKDLIKPTSIYFTNQSFLSILWFNFYLKNFYLNLKMNLKNNSLSFSNNEEISKKINTLNTLNTLNKQPQINQYSNQFNLFLLRNSKKIKMPIDLYILNLLELMLNKSSLILSINNTWKNLYLKSILQGIFKVKIIYLNSLINLNNNKNNDFKFLLLNNLITTQFKKSEKLKVVVNLSKMLITKQTKILTSFKFKYINYVFKMLENFKYSILCSNYTTKLFKKNTFSFFISKPGEIEKHISKEIESYLLNNNISKNLNKFLTNIWLNTFCLDFYVKFNLNNNTTNQLLYLLPFTHNGLGNIELFKNFVLTSLYEKEKKNVFINLFEKSKFYAGQKEELFLDYILFEQRKAISEKLYENANISSTNEEKYENLNNLNLNSQVIKNELLILKKMGKSFSNQVNKLTTNYNSYRSSNEFNLSKKPLYNNVYTLSHRERWQTEKDWQIFTLFTFTTIDNLDIPIYTYKDRLFSFMNSNISSNSFAPLFIENATLPILQNTSTFGRNDQRELTNSQQNQQSVVESSNFKSNYWNKDQKNKLLFDFIKQTSSFYSGAGIVQQLVNELDFYEIKKLDTQNRLFLYELNKYILKLKKQVQIFVYDKKTQLELKELIKKRDVLIRRTKLVRKLFRKNSNAASMILTLLPVLPPDLRPIVKMGNQIAASDLNRLYQKVIYRNDRLKKFLKDPATSQSYEMKYAQRLLQEAVDNLLQNGKSGLNSEKDARGRMLKSLSDILKGKQGRFRQFLLGKRVDYSGRSVIVVGPKLKLHECGLPFEMAKELYLPFLLKSILNKNYAKTVIGAKTLIKNNSSLAYELLREIMQVSPVLLNRAPTLHRLGIQAFVPKLIEGRAILLHPLVCSAFNADFDGDQMAVHIPITVEARAEAWKMMLSRNNILSTATGDPLAIPSQDMVLGCYYLTTFAHSARNSSLTALSNTKELPLPAGKVTNLLEENKIVNNRVKQNNMYFNSLYDVMQMYELRLLNVHSFVWVKWTNHIENGSDQEAPLEIRLTSSGQWHEITSNYYRIYNKNNNLISQYMRTTPGRILFNLIFQNTLINKDYKAY